MVSLRSPGGLKQGDPLPLSLWIIAEENVSGWLGITYHMGRGVLELSHLLISDDTVVFLNETESFFDNFMRFGWAFEISSGQRINKDKSSVHVSANAPL